MLVEARQDLVSLSFVRLRAQYGLAADDEIWKSRTIGCLRHSGRPRARGLKASTSISRPMSSLDGTAQWTFAFLKDKILDFSAKYGPWAVIAGASEGTGRAFARLLAAKGLSLVLIARRLEPLDELAAEIRSKNGIECVTASIDLSKHDAIDRIVEVTGNRDVGLFVSNAGSDPNGTRFLDGDVQIWIDLMNRNVMTTMQSSHHFGRKLVKRGRGGLLLVNSYACYGGGSFIAVYSATKAAELCFAEGLWAELNDKGVDVLTLVMGMTDTPEFRKVLAKSNRTLPPGTAAAEDVAAFGLLNLANGPVQNWGLTEAEAGTTPLSAADRRNRILALEEIKSSVFGEG